MEEQWNYIAMNHISHENIINCITDIQLYGDVIKLYENIEMYWMNIHVSLRVLLLLQILNDAMRDGSTWIEVLYLSHKELGFRVPIAKFGNEIFRILRTCQNVK